MSTAEVVVRAAEPGDVGAVLALWTQERSGRASLPDTAAAVEALSPTVPARCSSRPTPTRSAAP